MSGPRYQRTKRQDQRLVGFECQSCGRVEFPEHKNVCKGCGDAPADFDDVQLKKRGTIQTFVEQQYLPDEFETPLLFAIIDVPQVDGGESARVYGMLTETEREEIEIGTEVEARFRELLVDGDRPINSFKFAVPREDKA